MLIIDGIIYDIQKSIGGISVYFNNLMDFYNKIGYNYKLVTFNDDNNYSGNSNIIKSNCRFFERYREFKGVSDGDIFHSTYYRTPSTDRVKSVVTVHDFTYEIFRSGLPRKLHSWQKNKSILSADKIICISESTRDDLLRYVPGVDENKISVVYNSASDDYKVLVKRESDNADVVVFVGSRGGYKNFDVAIRSIAMSKYLRLGIVGGGALTESEKFLLQDLLPGRYIYFGSKSNIELNVIYNECYGLLYPSSYEGFGIPVLEAMKAGCPFVAVNASSIPEVAGPSGILVDNLSPQIICEALMDIGRSEVRNKVVSSGLIQANKFSWRESALKTIDVYNCIG